MTNRLRIAGLAAMFAATLLPSAAAKAAVERAEARRGQIKVTVDLAEIQVGRARQLRASNSIAQDELDSTDALYRTGRIAGGNFRAGNRKV